MRKNFAGLAFTASFMIAMLSLKMLLMPDEEEKKKRRARGESVNPVSTMLLINMLTRNYQDLQLYASPSVIETVTGNVAPALGVVTDFSKLMIATAKMLGDDPKRFKKAGKKLTKFLPVLSNLNKFDYMSSKDLGDIQSK
jgi:hypothetical protein